MAAAAAGAVRAPASKAAAAPAAAVGATVSGSTASARTGRRIALTIAAESLKMHRCIVQSVSIVIAGRATRAADAAVDAAAAIGGALDAAAAAAALVDEARARRAAARASSPRTAVGTQRRGLEAASSRSNAVASRKPR